LRVAGVPFADEAAPVTPPLPNPAPAVARPSPAHVAEVPDVETVVPDGPIANVAEALEFLLKQERTVSTALGNQHQSEMAVIEDFLTNAATIDKGYALWSERLEPIASQRATLSWRVS